MRWPDDLGKLATDRLAFAEAEEILRRDVDEGDREIHIEADDCDREAAQDVGGIGRGYARARRRAVAFTIWSRRSRTRESG